MRQERIDELKKKLYKCKTEQEVHTLVTNTISKYGGDVVCDDKDAVKFFESFDMFGEVKHNNIVNVTLDVVDDIDGDEVWYGIRVSITEHYIDSGSDDYVYSYDIL